MCVEPLSLSLDDGAGVGTDAAALTKKDGEEEKEEQSCIICCEFMDDEPSCITCDKASTTSSPKPCKLRLHRKCARFWRERGSTCPQCRHSWKTADRWHVVPRRTTAAEIDADAASCLSKLLPPPKAKRKRKQDTPKKKAVAKRGRILSTAAEEDAAEAEEPPPLGEDEVSPSTAAGNASLAAAMAIAHATDAVLLR